MKVLKWLFDEWFFHKILFIAFLLLTLLADVLPILRLTSPELAQAIVTEWYATYGTVRAFLREYWVEFFIFSFINMVFFPLMFTGDWVKKREEE